MITEGIHLIFNRIFKESSLHFEPILGRVQSTNISDIQKIAPPEDNCQKYLFSAQLEVPHIRGHKSVPIQGLISLQDNKNHKADLVDCSANASLETWELANGIVLSDGYVRLRSMDGKISARISGTIRYIDCADVETGGVLDTEILYDPEDMDRIYLGTLLKDAYLNIGKDIHLSGATIKFELCTKPYEKGNPLPYFIDEMDELLFQYYKPIPLTSMCIKGIGDNPITMSISMSAMPPHIAQTTLSVFPARLRVPFLGKNSYLFISNQASDESFSINIKDEWGAFISSTPHLTLVNSEDPSGPSLVEGGSFFIGRLECIGFSQARLLLASELINATAFPQSKWPQELPVQKITFAVSESGEPQLNLKFNQLAIDGFLISDAQDAKKPLEASLCQNGLSFGKGYSVSFGLPGQSRGILPAFIIDNKCDVWINTDGRKIDLREWIREHCSS
jgi:hypothetical protein